MGHGTRAAGPVRLVRATRRHRPIRALRQRAAERLDRARRSCGLLGQRILTSLLHGREPGPEASIRKTLADAHGQHVMALAKDMTGAAGMLGHQGPDAEERRRVALGLPVLPGPHDRRRHERGAAQHHRRAGARPAPGADVSRMTDDRRRRRSRPSASTREGYVLRVTIDRPGDDLNRGRRRAAPRSHAPVPAAPARARGAGRAAHRRRSCLLGRRRLRLVPVAAGAGDRLEQLRLDAKAMIWDLLDVHLPIVCALNGHAIGLGASIALLCDAVFMARSATIADPHVRVGIVAGDGGTVAWPLAVGPMRAKRWLLTGDAGARRRSRADRPGHRGRRRRGARRARMAFAQRLAAGAPLAVQATKQAVNQLIKDALDHRLRPRDRARDASRSARTTTPRRSPRCARSGPPFEGTLRDHETLTASPICSTD